MSVTERLARATSRHPWRTLGAWLGALVAALGLSVAFLPGNLTTDAYVTSNPESRQAERLFYHRFPPDRHAVDELVVVRSELHTVADPAFRRFVERLLSERAAHEVIWRASTYYSTPDRSLVSRDRHATLITIQRQADVDPLLEVVRRENGRAGFSVAMTGEGTLDHDFNELSQHDLKSGELSVGLPAALLVLLLVFGAVVAGLVPLFLAIVSIVVALGLCAVVAEIVPVSVFLVNMLTGMGLALGIDYSLFVVSRYREERSRRLSELEAIPTAGATASRAVLFSGTVFVVALTGMLLVPSNVMKSLALGAIAVGVVSVLAALTLLPALLGLLGDRVNALRVPWLGRNVGREAAREGRFWGAIVRGVMRRPVISLVVFAALLVAAATPAFGLRLGASGVSTLPDRLEAKRGFEALARDFPQASSAPALIVVEGRVGSPPVRAAIARLRRELARNPAFGQSDFRTSSRGDLAAIGVQVAGDKTGERALDAIRHLRSEVIPRDFRGTDARVLVGGDTADNVDFIDAMNAWLPIVFAFVLLLSFVLVTVVFRSLVIAAASIVLNLLSVGAAYGLVVLVFRHGVGAGLLGFQRVDAIEAWVPLFLFSVLFGLSMDYQVFLLSRIKERYEETGSTSEAVSHGVTSTARLITGAALIIVAVFAGFAMGDLVMFQQMGFGIAAALLIDATIIRSVLLPAAMHLLGRWNWYLPSWLDWLPRIEIEARGRRQTLPTSGR
ncbi:MAG TPA: MMPL family transporter [Gaiellaceae bacterium]|nr:MMPL family transporter [Gaiellaceae bacterium]